MTPIIVTIGYGHEHPVFSYCKDLWSAYSRNFSDYKFIFHRLSHELELNEIRQIDSELLIDEYDFTSKKNNFAITHQLGYPKQIARWIKLLNFIISNQSGPFWLYAPTVTSVIDFRALDLIINSLECKNVYAGGLLNANIPENFPLISNSNSLFRILSGSGFLISSDLIHLILKRAHQVPHFFPDDVWISLILKDIPRIPLKRFDITEKFNTDYLSIDLFNQLIIKARLDGHFHFRVKSSRFNLDGTINYSSQYHDPILLNNIMLNIISNKIDDQDFLNNYLTFRINNSDSLGNYANPISL